MVMHNPDVIIRGASFIDFGRSFKDKLVDEPALNIDGSPGAGANQRGRYVLHLHRNLPRMNQPLDTATATPARVEDCVVWGGPGWGFVHHDSFAVFENNVAFDVAGSDFVQEAGNEIGLWRGNLSIKTTGDSDPRMTVEPFGPGANRVARFDFGFNGALSLEPTPRGRCGDSRKKRKPPGNTTLLGQVSGGLTNYLPTKRGAILDTARSLSRLIASSTETEPIVPWAPDLSG